MRYYCDYCDMYLPHGSARSRRQHNYGWKHRANYKAYYQNIFVKQQRELLEAKRHILPPSVIAEMEREIMQFQPVIPQAQIPMGAMAVPLQQQPQAIPNPMYGMQAQQMPPRF